MVTFEVPSLPYVQAAYATMQKDVEWIDHRVETVSDCYGEAKGELSKQIRQLLPRLEDDLKQKANIGRNLLETIRDDLKREEKRAQELVRLTDKTRRVILTLVSSSFETKDWPSKRNGQKIQAKATQKCNGPRKKKTICPIVECDF